MEALSLLFTMILFGSTAILAVRTTQQWRIEQSRELYDLQFPHDLQADEVSRFMRSLSALVPGANRKLLGHEAAIFEVWATRDGISHRLHLPGRLAKPIITQLRATVPGVRVAPVPGGSSSMVKLRGAVELGLTGSLAPLNVPDPVAITTAILASLQPLGREEAAVMQWTLVPCSMRGPARPRIPGVIVPRLPWWAQAAFNLMRPKELTADEISAMKTKLAEPVFAGVCRVGATARSTARVRQIMRQVSAPLNIASNHPARFVRQPAPS
ncbi:MAG TPA: hypothetical protein VMS08_02720, partial [Candidatus Saccharimonadia bacterium]|nr:hypothetical protein [Candidatus Saccharimonadia bacterium]